MALQYSNRAAIIHNGQPLTYAALHGLALETARRLGVRPGVVGVLTARAPGTVVALLGIWAAGGAYCPIDPRFPPERQLAMLAAAGCDVVVAAEPGLGAPPGVRVVELPASAEPPGVDMATAQLGPDDPAYTLFTSGSTGAPKPVVTPHGAIAACVTSLQELFGVGPDDRVLQFASLNWDTSFEEILPALTTGATLVFDDEAYTGSIPRLLRAVTQRRVSVLDLPTAFWHELVHHLREDQLALPESLRLVIIGGEAARAARLADWCALASADVRLLNTYGCTETTLITHAVDLHGPLAPRFPEPWTAAERVPLGWPLPHVTEHLSPDGELCIGGPALALGYGGLPEATAARFVTVDTADGPRRCFRTGDRVRRTDDGMLVHYGRLDGEIKIRGIRVDPAEVEAHLTRHPGVAAAAVVGAPIADHTVLVAYVVASGRGDEATLARDVIEQLRARVPAHLVPSRVHVVAELALTASGKVDRAGSHRQYAARHSGEERAHGR